MGRTRRRPGRLRNRAVDSAVYAGHAEVGGGDPSVLATDLADHLVMAGMPFRQAHDVSGSLVRRAEELGIPVSDVDQEQRVAIDPLLRSLPDDLWDAEASIERRNVHGGSARERVLEQLRAAGERLSDSRGNE